jgi:hypothetical protein
VELLEWLNTVGFPHERFRLRPWVDIVDIARFVATLRTELASEVIGHCWRAAADDLRQPVSPAHIGAAIGGVPFWG